MSGQSLEDMRVAQLNAERSCPHGAMRRRAGINKAGKPWAGWFCPEDLCKPDWADVEDIISGALAEWAAGTGKESK